MHDSLGDWLSRWTDAGQVLRIAAEVDPAVELSEVARRHQSANPARPVVFFEQVRGSKLPVAANLWATPERILQACGVAHWADLSRPASFATSSRLTGPPSFWGRMTESLAASSSCDSSIRLVRHASVQHVVQLARDLTLWSLPIPRLWPQEELPAITGALSFLVDPHTTELAVERPLIQIVDGQSAVFRWPAFSRSRSLIESAMATGQSLALAVVLGGDPLLPIAASLAEREPINVVEFVAQRRSSPVPMAPCRTVDVRVPAEAEVILEGVFDPTIAPIAAPPYALPTAGFSDADSCPVWRASCVTHRANPVWPISVSPIDSPGESCLIEAACDRLWLPTLQQTMPNLLDLRRPANPWGRSVVLAVIRKSHPDDGRRTIHSLWGLRALSDAKLVVVTDEISLAGQSLDHPDILARLVAMNVDFQRDLLVDSMPFANWDPCRQRLFSAGESRTQRVGIDATAKAIGGHATRSNVPQLTPEWIERLAARAVELKLPE